MSARVRAVAWSSFAVALLLHGATFAALSHWMRIGSEQRALIDGNPDVSEYFASLPPEADAVFVEPLPDDAAPPPEEFPEIPRAADEPLAASEPEPLAGVDPGVEIESAAEPGDALRAPGAIGLGAWRRGGNVRVGHGCARSAHASQAAAAPVLPAVAPPSPPPGETRPPRFGSPPDAPVYPLTARRRGWEGVVVLRLDVSAAGEVTSVQVVTSSGRDLLDEAAVGAAQSWRLAPALADGVAVPGTIDVPVRFRLDS